MRRYLSRFARLLLIFASTLVLLSGAVLWQLSRELPVTACRWLERRLSQGPVSFTFTHASLILWKGVQLRDVRVHPKRSLGPPLFHADEIHLAGRVAYNRPPAEWIEAVSFYGMKVGPYQEWPTSDKAARPIQAWASLFDPSQPSGALFSRPVKILVEQSKIHGVESERIAFTLRSMKDRLFLEGIRIDFETPRFHERLDGYMSYDFSRQRLQANVSGTLTPDVIEELCLLLDGRKAVEIFDLFDQPVAPMAVSGSMIVERQKVPHGPILYDMRVAAQSPEIRYRGIPLEKLDFNLQWYRDGEKRLLTVAPINVMLAEGEAEVAIAYNPARHLTDFTLRSKVPASLLLQGLGMPPPEVMTNFNFSAAPLIDVAGTQAGRLAERESALQARFSCDQFAFRSFQLDKASADVEVISSNRIEVSNVSIDGYGGRLTGTLNMARAPDNITTNVALNVTVRQVDVASVIKDYGSKSKMGGKLNGHMQLAFPLNQSKIKAMTGSGGVSVKNGEVLRIQLFAGLTDFLGRNVPGVDALLMQSDASLPFMVTNGVVFIDNLKVEGNLFSMTAKGKLRLTKPGYPLEGLTRMRFFKQKTFMGMLARVVTLPINKMMEFRVSGPVMHPEWNYIGLIDRIIDSFRGNSADEDEKATPSTTETP